MSKKFPKSAKILSVIAALSVLMTFSTVFADDTTSSTQQTTTTVPSSSAVSQVPFLKAVEFTGAEIEGEFKSDIYEYTLNVTSYDELDLKSYTASDPLAKIKFNYISNKSGAKKGIIITVEKDGISRDYKFYYDSMYTATKTSDATLSELFFNYAELSPEFKSDVYKYTLYLPSDLEVLTFEATTKDAEAVINTPTEIKLEKDQTTPITIMVTSSDGTQTASYKLNIKRVDKTLEQVKKEMADPNYTTFVVKPFYETATFYVIVLCSAFALALMIIIIISVKRSKNSNKKKRSKTQTIPTEKKAFEPADEHIVQANETEKQKLETKVVPPASKGVSKEEKAAIAPPAANKAKASAPAKAETVRVPKPAVAKKESAKPLTEKKAQQKVQQKPQPNKTVPPVEKPIAAKPQTKSESSTDWLDLGFDLSKYDNYGK